MKNGKPTKAVQPQTPPSQKTLWESEGIFRILFETSRDALMTVEPPYWQLTSANKASVKMFRAKDLEELLSFKPIDLSPEQQPDGSGSKEMSLVRIETAMREGSHFFEWTHRRLNGELFPANVLLTRIEIAGKGFLQASVRDITEQKRAEELIKKSEEETAQFALSGSNVSCTFDIQQELWACNFDLTVPGGMGGRSAVEEIRKTNLEIPVFVISGYADDPTMKDPVGFGFTASICKPFRMMELSVMLNKHLRTT